MGLFGKSFEEKVQTAVERVRGQFPGAQINARVDQGETVTLTGHAADIDTKTQIMAAFNAAVETKNTLNQITVEKPIPLGAGTQFGSAPLGTTSATEPRTHTVASGDTLSALAKRFYGDASKYNRIFEANRDQLSDPDKIKVGQKLKIPT
ncbi:MAG TPA: LysM peptidoglycan-binding domain-containing protein [Thermoanaerobaculia bacterium]|nr:LysM peptidoglycan-binding domain-containing protein [Thermoanaerobaculia bacterium]